MFSKVLLTTLGIAATAIAVAAAASPASAAPPGSNGKVVFISDRDGDDEIFSMNPDGTGLTQLTYNDDDDWSPEVSPDGSHVAFESHRDGDYEIYVMDIDGTQVTRLTNQPGFDLDPSWSPTATRSRTHPTAAATATST